MGSFKNCFRVNAEPSSYSHEARFSDNSIETIRTNLWGIKTDSFTADRYLRDTFIDMNTGKPFNKNFGDIMKDMIEKPGETKLGILCPDNTLRKVQMIKPDDEKGCYLSISDTPEAAPPKPGKWKRFINLFKKKKDPEVQRYNDWQEKMAAVDKVKKLAPRGAETNWGSAVSGSTIEDYWKEKDSFLNGEDEPVQKVDKRSEVQKQYQNIMTRAKRGDFGSKGIDQAKFINSMEERLSRTEWANENFIQASTDGTVNEDRVRLYIASLVSLRIAADKNVSAEEYSKWNINEMKDLVMACNTRDPEMPLQKMYLSTTRDLGTQAIKHMNRVNQKMNPTGSRNILEPEKSRRKEEPENDLPELIPLREW